MVENTIKSVDVIVVGSGVGGMLTAIRAHDLGLKVVVIEKSHHYGGTSALSGGGVWIPNNSDLGSKDSREKALMYLRGVTKGKANNQLLQAYVDNGPAMVEYARSVGMGLEQAPGYPDYFSERPDAVAGRTMLAVDFDGKRLGKELFRMRTSYPSFLAFDRYALNLKGAYALMSRQKGWLWEGFKLVAGYWIDFRWRLRTKVDSRLSMGRAQVGALRKAMIDRGIPLLLNTRLVGIEMDQERISGARFRHNGSDSVMKAHAVILATGGFEQNQEMRNKYHTVPTEVASSLTPDCANEGDGILLGQMIGADIGNMGNAWWVPTIRLPGKCNTELAGQVFFDRSRPGVICVNRLGKRFCNEALSYDRFGNAMIEDHRKTGANLPCWMIFDAQYRKNFPASDILPGWVRSDNWLPPEYWDNIIYRADSIDELARKIGVDPIVLTTTINNMNSYAKSGIDPEFHRGETDFDKFFGDARATPNANLGPIDKAPFYAIRLELGDIGTKGGLRVDEYARVLNTAGDRINGLYATGNTTSSLFLDVYPGAGSTLGPALVFGFVAANHVADMLANRDHTSKSSS
ncbi:3-oxosteroid 1-dehydrogenase [Advenella incenata]|uniref:3-oxosteroid 1-dehydrogenase n=1 Tax=Advenella incenata TaxID=267800 RepID=A0A4V2FSM6_9BURK|nr:FAD-dependent oxidoreductase [Advenella incenata]RZT94875.1 3-oxosteroid 1-dehydrogenase [Advenella incenata]